MNFNEPVNQNRSHSLIDVFLPLQEAMLCLKLMFSRPKIFKYFHCILSTRLRIFRLAHIHRVYLRLIVDLNSLLELLKCGSRLVLKNVNRPNVGVLCHRRQLTLVGNIAAYRRLGSVWDLLEETLVHFGSA